MTLRNLLFEREDADYADFVEVDKDDAEEAYKNAVSFVGESTKVAGKILDESRSGRPKPE